MKNIHLFPTEKPSRLHLKSDGFYLTKEENSFIPYSYPQDIYITSDEEIKKVKQHKGKWHLEKGKILNWFPNYLTDLSECKLVILTTDPDLINDGVQAIPDEFLEWFVKNPSCEKVKVEIETTSIQLPQQQLSENSYDLAFRWINKKVYKIIIPQEEPTPVWKQIIESCGGEEEFMESAGLKPKQETLEEAAENESEYLADYEDKEAYQKAFIAGANYQAERMYSEEDVMNALHSVELKHNKDYSKIYEGIKEFLNNLKK
jgi:hypothetical protein